jgi:hypothetical protein
VENRLPITKKEKAPHFSGAFLRTLLGKCAHVGKVKLLAEFRPMIPTWPVSSPACGTISQGQQAVQYEAARIAKKVTTSASGQAVECARWVKENTQLE